MDGPILPHDLPKALDGFPDIAVLSLDCFDTLLWRDCHAPMNVFTALPGVQPRQRMWAERAARIERLFRSERTEVTLPEIYGQLLPNADPATIAGFAAAELAAESAFCFGFAPTIALMEAARARGLKIIIISDTYLGRDELATLIAAAAGPEVLALIDAIYCSSVYGVSKANGLIGRVVAELGLPATAILHVGDNGVSDFAAGRTAGVNVLHLIQFNPRTEQRLRLEAAISTVVHGNMGADDLPFQSHRAALAIAEPQLDDAAMALGYTTLGPVLASFADWLAAERAALAATSAGRVHTLFLMRDGHLPREVFESDPARAGTSSALEISRFTATAMSFVDQEAILRFVEQNVGSGFSYILGQLLFEPREITNLLRGLPGVNGRSAAFMRIINAVQTTNRVVSRSKALARRLCAHIMAVAAPAPGDTLLLVDLGYNGSVQNLVEPVLRSMLGVEIAGRYLLYRSQQLTGYDKKGFIDERHYDFDALLAMSANVAVVEQLCTVAQGSVIDYAVDGRPIRSGSVIKGRQSEVRDAVQAGCIAFARHQGAAITRPTDPNAAEARRRSAVAVLARLMFLPQPHELEVIARFEHDVNLGTAETVKLFDPEVATRGMQHQGMFYLKNNDRMYLPAELRGQGLPVSLAMLALKRFNLGLSFEDFCDRTIGLPVLVADGRDVATDTIVATPTHDGYFLASIPVGEAQFTIGVQFGKLYEAVQIAMIRFRPVAMALDGRHGADAGAIAAVPTLEGMDESAPGIFCCADAAGFVMVPPPGQAGGALLLEIVFRPLLDRLPVPVEGREVTRVASKGR